ncbi:hypothetical protein Cni_G04057 [Canna indica]|uniref:Pentatricopeptide repeat-containing protein n=1 Tax=Canna indica TaxID=4628 RepID=A0AAQ3Q3M2_9LILI|nr:hypothetical protein Cni_G04057 [Canna indica]
MLELSAPQNQIKAGVATPSIRSFDLLLSFVLGKARKPSLVLGLFSQITSNSVPIRSCTHSLVSRALLQSRRFQEARRFISRASLDFGFAPRNSLFDALIRGLCVAERNPDEALSVIQECVRDLGICPSLVAVRSVVLAFCSEGRMDRAVEVLEAVADKKDRISIDNFVCSSIISGFSRIGAPTLGLEFYERARKVEGFHPNLVTSTTVVDALCREGRFDEACDLIRKMEDEGVVLDAVLYTCLIDGYLKRGDLMEGLRKHKYMTEKGIFPDLISYTSTIDGLCKEGSVEKVIGFLDVMEKKGIKANLVTYTTVIRGFCRRNKLEEAFHVLKRVEDSGFVADEFVYSILIDGLCSKGDLAGVFNLLEEMERKEIKVGAVTYNTVINSLCKAGLVSKADEFSKGYTGDNFTYAILLHGYLKELDVARLLEVKRRLDESGISPDIVTCNVLIKALFMAGMFEDACKLFNELPKMGLTANSITYNSMINEFCKVGFIEKALLLFDQYQRGSSFTSASTHSCMIKGLCKHNMTEEAIKVFEDLTEKNLLPDPTTYRILLRALYREADGEGLLNFFHKMENIEPKLLSLMCNDAVVLLCTKGCFTVALNVYMLLRMKYLSVTSKSYYVLLKGLLLTGDKQISEIVLSEFIKAYGTFVPQMTNAMFLYLSKKNVEKAIYFLNVKSKRITSICALTMVINALKKEGRVEDACKFLLQSEENGSPVDVIVYSSVVNGLCKSGYLEKALDLCASMKKKGVHPNIVIYNSVINGLCEQGCLTEAFRIFDSLEKHSVPPTVVTYSTLIGALSREGFLDAANQLFRRMIVNGIIPNTRVYNNLINGYCSFGLVEEAINLFSDMEKSSLNPDAFTFAAIINGFCRRGDVEGGLVFFTKCRTEGKFPDFLGFMNLTKGLFAKGRMEEARSILRDMLKCAEIVNMINSAGGELDVESLDSLLSLACEQGRIEEVILVLDEIAYISFSSARSNNRGMFMKLKEMHDSGVLDIKSDKTDGQIGCHPLAAEVHGKLYSRSERKFSVPDTISAKHEFSEESNEDGDEDIHEYLTGKPLGYDFATYYSIISWLCRRGDLHKANNAVRAMLQNSEKVFSQSLTTL